MHAAFSEAVGQPNYPAAISDAHDLAKRWVLKPVDEECAARQAEQLSISSLVARFCLRGYAEVDSARRYFSSSLSEDLPSPFEMADMEAAVRRDPRRSQPRANRYLGRLRRRRHDRRVCAGVLPARDRRAADLPCAAPYRRRLRPQCRRIARLKERGVDLLLTVDCGISNAREVAPRGNSISTWSSSIIISRRRAAAGCGGGQSASQRLRVSR